jgi:predicted transcriptional regulator
MEREMSKKKTVNLIAIALQQATEPISARQIAAAIDRPLRSVHNSILRMRNAGLLDTQTVKPIDTRVVNLYTWKAQIEAEKS